MTLYGYEITILVGMMMLLVWYNSLPYDNAVFNAWDDKTKQSARGDHILQNPSMSRISGRTDLYIRHLVEEITKIAVYFAVPSVILYKMFIIVKRELGFNLWY